MLVTGAIGNIYIPINKTLTAFRFTTATVNTFNICFFGDRDTLIGR